jgi:hypothetical protein
MNTFNKILQSFPTVGRQRLIAEWYRDLATFNANGILDIASIPAYRALARECKQLASELDSKLKIGIVDIEPYSTADIMFKDIADGRFWVSSRNCSHPIFSFAENIDFRIVHDVMGHYPSGGQFDWPGELLACQEHATHLSDLAQRALFSDCIGQTAYALTYGHFGPQKCGLHYA